MDEDMIELDENEDTGIIKVDENEDIDVIEVDENEDIGNVALKNLLKGEKGDTGEAELYNKRPFEVYGTFTLATQQLTEVTAYYNEIKEAHEAGRPVKLHVTIVESGNIASADVSVLDVSKKSAFFYPIMRTNIGFGTQIYFFDVEIKQDTASLTSHVLQSVNLGE